MGKERLAVLEKLFSVCPKNVGKTAAKELHQNAIKCLEAIRNRAENGETIRIWYSNMPDEMSGFYWIMSMLKEWELSSAKVVFIKRPEWETENETLIQQNSWGEVEPGKWHRYLSLQKAAPPVLVQAVASRWAELQHENAALRAVVNGRLQSVPENFYDHFIIREIAAEGDEFHEANLIGRILGKYQLGIGDGWLCASKK